MLLMMRGVRAIVMDGHLLVRKHFDQILKRRRDIYPLPTQNTRPFFRRARGAPALLGWDDFGGYNDFGHDDCVFEISPIRRSRSNPVGAPLPLARSARAELPVVAAAAAVGVVCLVLLLCAKRPVVAAAHTYDDGHHERRDGDGNRENHHDEEVDRRRRVDIGVG